jgi:hypothetical protein
MEHRAAAAVAIVITLVIFTPYLLAVWRGSLHPHVVSWVIWGLTTMLVGGGQFLAGAGVGAAPILVSGVLSSAVAVLAFACRRRGQVDARVTRFDGWCLAIVLACIPVWLATGDERWSMLMLTGIDLVGFAPTVRTVWRRPHGESALLFLAFGVRNAVAIVAVEAVHLSTVVFPGVIGAACFGMVALIWVRRRVVAPPCRSDRIDAQPIGSDQ